MLKMKLSSRKVVSRDVRNISQVLRSKKSESLIGITSQTCKTYQTNQTSMGIILLMLPDLQMNDHLRLRKPHPCGSYEWTVVRLGADIGLECKGCQHKVMLTRRELMKRMKTNLSEKERQSASKHSSDS